MNTKAYISTWHNYSESLNTDYYKLFYDYFIKQFPLWCDFVDTVYIIDTNWNFSDADKKRLTDIKKKVVFLKSPTPGSHAVQYQHFLPEFKEDQLLFMDNDCFVLHRSGVLQWFWPDKDAVIQLANHGGLNEPIKAKYPIAQGADCFDMAHFMVSRKFLNSLDKIDFNSYQPFPVGTYIKELDYTTKKDDWCEVFGLLFYHILASKKSIIGWKFNNSLEHFHGGSYIYLLPTYKVKGLPQYWEYLKSHPKEKIRQLIDWFYKLGGECNLCLEMLIDL